MTRRKERKKERQKEEKRKKERMRERKKGRKKQFSFLNLKRFQTLAILQQVLRIAIALAALKNIWNVFILGVKNFL